MKSQASPGFSFVELMVYIVIVAILMAVGGYAYFGMVARARMNNTTQNLQLLKQSINLFKLEHGKYPAQLQDLSQKPKGELGKRWHQYIDKVPKDGWNQEFYYKVTPGGKRPYELYSLGGATDAQEAQEEDSIVSVWEL